MPERCAWERSWASLISISSARRWTRKPRSPTPSTRAADYGEIDAVRKHVISYLGDFLFPPERVRAPVKSLSGGERNRLLLARLFSRPANVLGLDEPTNDLDIENTDLLEDLLQEFPG